MSTPTTSEVTRITLRSYDGRHREAHGRQLLATIGAGDILTIRPKGRRTGEVKISILDLYDIAMGAEARALMRQTAAAK